MNSPGRVFVVGAHVPNGGTYMAYHVGLLLAQHLGAHPIAVRIEHEDASHEIFDYEVAIPSISIAQLVENMRASDALVLNPGFSRFDLGIRFPGLRLMYAQGWNSADAIDLMDIYVGVSSFVADFLRFAYGLNVPVIPPFIHDVGADIEPWEHRRDNVIAVFNKGADASRMKTLFDVLAQRVTRIGVAARFEILQGPKPQKKFLDELSHYRQALFLSPREGFGLVPLEAMARNVTVIAFDGGGGRDYMWDRSTALVTRYPDIEGLADRVAIALKDPLLSSEVATNGALFAKGFSRNRFTENWNRLFQHHPAVCRHYDRLRG